MALPLEFWLWAKWCDKGKIPHTLDPRVPKWLKAHTKNGRVPLSWHLRYMTHTGGTPPPPPPPPPTGIDLRPAQSWIFMAQEPQKALWYPPYYKIAFTADGAYEKPNADLINQLRGRGQQVRSWCDCHSTFPDTAKQMAHDFGLDGWIGEGESAPAFDVAVQGGAKIIVGNLSALTADQKELIRDGKVLWINELYLNQDFSRASREDWQNLPVAGRCIAFYDASNETDGGRYVSYAEYAALGKFQAHKDSFYDPGARDSDRLALP